MGVGYKLAEPKVLWISAGIRLRQPGNDRKARPLGDNPPLFGFHHGLGPADYIQFLEDVTLG